MERVAQPMVAGIYGADPMTLSLLATFPRFQEMERAHGSVILGLRAKAQRAEGKEQRAEGEGRRAKGEGERAEGEGQSAEGASGERVLGVKGMFILVAYPPRACSASSMVPINTEHSTWARNFLRAVSPRLRIFFTLVQSS